MKLSEKSRRTRDELGEILAETLKVAIEKYHRKTSKTSLRQSWARIIISGVAEYNRLLESCQLDDLLERIIVLEQQRAPEVAHRRVARVEPKTDSENIE